MPFNHTKVKIKTWCTLSSTQNHGLGNISVITAMAILYLVRTHSMNSRAWSHTQKTEGPLELLPPPFQPTPPEGEPPGGRARGQSPASLQATSSLRCPPLPARSGPCYAHVFVCGQGSGLRLNKPQLILPFCCRWELVLQNQKRPASSRQYS